MSELTLNQNFGPNRITEQVRYKAEQVKQQVTALKDKGVNWVKTEIEKATKHPRKVLMDIRDSLRGEEKTIIESPSTVAQDKKDPEQKTSKSLSEEYMLSIGANSADLKVLLANIPQHTKENDPIFFELTKIYGDDIEKYVALKLNSYKKQLGADMQDWGISQVAQDMQRLKDYTSLSLGQDKTLDILEKAQAQKKTEPEKTASSNINAPTPEMAQKNPILSENGRPLATEQVQRQYGIDDIKEMQKQFKAFSSGNYAPANRDFYDYLATEKMSSSFKAENINRSGAEKEANPQDYDTLILGFYNDWRTNLIKNKDHIAKVRPEVIRQLGDLNKLPQPKTLIELRELYHKYPVLNEFSAAQYQDGIGDEGMINTPFIHFQGHRQSGYEYDKPETQMRIYLNPPQEALPQLASEFIDIANQENVPFYFKLIDFSLQKQGPADIARKDRMIFYTDKKSAEQVAQVLDKIKAKHPDWFDNRTLPTMTAKLTDGIGIAEDPSDFQNKNFSRMGDKKTSFNWVRAQFLNEVWSGATKDIVLQNPDVRLPDGRSLKDVFYDSIPQADRASADTLWNNRMEPARLKGDDQLTLARALSMTMVDIIPKLKSETLLPYITNQTNIKAKKYGINPNNIALNAT